MNLISRRTHVLPPAGRAAWAVAICVAASGGCARHRVATTFSQLESGLKPGRTVYVTSTTGQVQKGTLERFRGASVDVTVSRATVHVLERDTVRIAVPEPLWQGAVIGAATGALLGGLAQGAGEAYGCILSATNDCGSKNPAAGLLIGAGMGGAIGAGLDALIGKRTTIFAPPQAGTGARVVLSPTAGPRGVGLRVMYKF